MTPKAALTGGADTRLSPPPRRLRRGPGRPRLAASTGAALLSLLGLSGVVATVADAQPARQHARIGLLANLPSPQIDAFRDGLKDLG